MRSHGAQQEDCRQIVLIGLPGVGKTTVGTLLADRAGLEFIDVDDFLETQQGKPVTQIFADQGESAFRALEADAIDGLLAHEEAVIALGGGAVVTSRVRTLLANRCVVWLTASLDHTAERIGQTTHRPLMRGDVAATLTRLDGERTGFYEQLASHRVATDGRTPGEIAADLAATLGLGQAGA